MIHSSDKYGKTEQREPPHGQQVRVFRHSILKELFMEKI
jgi:hypothetical protein